MNPRKESLTIPDTPRYWSVEIGSKGAHHFRDMTYSKAMRMIPRLQALKPNNAASMGAPAMNLGGLAIGLTWHHRAYTLATPFPGWDGDLDDYGDEVIGELQDAGYSLSDVTALISAVLDRTTGLLTEQREVAEKASFSEAPKEPSTSP